jgi:hypothetical protein
VLDKRGLADRAVLGLSAMHQTCRLPRSRLIARTFSDAKTWGRRDATSATARVPDGPKHSVKRERKRTGENEQFISGMGITSGYAALSNFSELAGRPRSKGTSTFADPETAFSNQSRVTGTFAAAAAIAVDSASMASVVVRFFLMAC